MGSAREDPCRVYCIDPAAVSRIEREMPRPPVVEGLAGIFKVLGDETRIRILFALSRSELCVCDLAAILGMSSSAVSHQLRVLRDARLVKCRRDGKRACYTLDDAHVLNLFEQGLEHVSHAAI